MGSCPKGWMEFGGSCYLHHDERLTWSEAEKRCQELSAHLVSIGSPEEQQFVNSCELQSPLPPVAAESFVSLRMLRSGVLLCMMSSVCEPFLPPAGANSNRLHKRSLRKRSKGVSSQQEQRELL
ncbi:hypothetical protein GOODEAATRI_023182, partial [Goodea atripinnis]